MSGHSKWSTIKHKKGATDAKRANVFTKLIKEIMIAAKMGGGDPGGNPRLRLAIDKAKAQSMPKDKIERAVKKGTGELAGENIEEVSYEGYGPAGVAILVDCTTDNTNRTVADVRNIFGKKGGNLGETGSVAWMFEKKGQIQVEASSISEEELFEKALDAGAEDIQKEDAIFIVSTSFEDFHKTCAGLEKAGVTYKEAALEMVPKTTIKVEDEENARKVLALIEALEDYDDVQNVWPNFDIDDELLSSLTD